MILENTLSLLRQQVVVNSLLNEQMLTLCSHFNNYDDDFLKKIRIKKSVNYYNKFLHEHSKWTCHLAWIFCMLFKHYACEKIKILYVNIFFKNEIKQIWIKKKLNIDFIIFMWDDFIFFLLNQIDDKQNRDFMIVICFTDLTQWQNQTVQFFLTIYDEMYHKLSSDQEQQKTQLFFVKLHSELCSVIQNYQNSSTNQVELVLLATHLERLHNIKRKFRIKNTQSERNKNKKFSKSCFNKNS